jgi:hypothetical protein
MPKRTLTDAYMLRMPDGMREVIKIAATRNRRSMNAEILFHLESIFREAAQPEAAAQKE